VEEAPPGALHLWWLGQSGFLVKVDGRLLLLDPYLSDSLTEKYSGTPTPHVRMTRRVVDPARLGFVDVVTASHGHTDHLDAETLRAVRPRALVCPPGARALAYERAGVVPRVVDEDESVSVAGFDLTAVHAEHDVPGGAVGFVVRCGAWTLYHSGDTERIRDSASGYGASRPTSRSCRSTATSGTWAAARPRPSRRRRGRASRSRVTSRCSSSTPPRRTSSWRHARGWRSRAGSSVPASV
jgi:L-ascorbate metabolism protein UlaG (beta-lactamase superfamily)